MFAQRFGQFILKGRWQAFLSALLFAALPFLTWVSGVIVGLVTLRKGSSEGFLTALWASLPSIIFAIHDKTPFLVGVAISSFLIWALAMLLRKTANWALVLCAAALAGVSIVGIFHIVEPNTAAWWIKHLTASASNVEQNLKIPAEQQQNLKRILENISLIATGLQVMLYSFMVLMELFFARGLESSLFNKGKLAHEAKRIRLTVWAGIALLIMAFLARFEQGFFLDALPVLVLPFVFAGVSVVHFVMTQGKLRLGWFIAFYALIVFMVFFVPALLMIFMFLALLDSAVNIRLRWCKTS